MKAIYATASLIHDIQNNEYNLPEGTIILLERYSILLQKKTDSIRRIEPAGGIWSFSKHLHVQLSR